jgi:ferric-chelate reductase (NADPH)
MSPVPQFLTNAIGRVFFRAASVSDAVDLSSHVRLIELAGESLIAQKWIPGQKVQFHLGNLLTRTYTPTAWNPIAGSAQFVVFLHGNGPGSAWAAALKKGDLCQFTGPRESLNLAQIKEQCIFFGDETSLGAAQALHRSSSTRQTRYVLEVPSSREGSEILQHLSIPNAQCVARTPDGRHLLEVEQILVDTAAELRSAEWVFTGNAQSIQSLRRMLRSRRIVFSQLKTKVYWAQGKTGLD